VALTVPAISIVLDTASIALPVFETLPRIVIVAPA
jgi:hypothetical protein